MIGEKRFNTAVKSVEGSVLLDASNHYKQVVFLHLDTRYEVFDWETSILTAWRQTVRIVMFLHMMKLYFTLTWTTVKCFS